MKVQNVKAARKHLANALGWTHEAMTLQNAKLACSGLTQKGPWCPWVHPEDSGTLIDLTKTENVTDDDLREGLTTTLCNLGSFAVQTGQFVLEEFDKIDL